MMRAIAHYLPREMAILGTIEALLSFAVISLIVDAAGASAGLAPQPALSLNHGLGLVVCLTILLNGIALGAGLYRPDICADSKRLPSGWSTLFAGLAALLVLGGATENRLSTDYLRWQAELLTGWGTAIAATRIVHGLAIGRRSLTRKILLLGDRSALVVFQATLDSVAGHHFEPVVLPQAELSWEVLRDRRFWGIILVADPGGRASTALLECKMRGMRIMRAAVFQEAYLGRRDLDALTVERLLSGPRLNAGKASALIKRCLDIVLAMLLLVLTFPLMLAVAIAIRLDSAGPVLYRQQRTGQFGWPFTLLKFRSMTTNAEAGGNPAGRRSMIRASPRSGGSSAPRASMSCRSWSTCCAAK